MFNVSAPNLGPSTAPLQAAPPLNLNGLSSNPPTNSLFGNTQQNTAAPPTTSLFGNTASNNTTSGLFGNNNKNTSTGSSLFGNTNTAGAGNLFGNTGTNSTVGGGSLFGNNTTSNTTGGSLFGNSNNTTTATTGSLFGNNTTSNTTGGGLFGNNNTTTGGGLFGNSNNNNMFMNVSSLPNDSPLSQIERINSLYDPGPRCLFQHIFYSTYSLQNNNNNAIQPQSSTSSFLSPPNSIPEQTWKQAIEQNNPDKNNLIPTPLYGFKQLKERAEQQTKNIPKISELVQKLLNTIEKIKLEAIKNNGLLNECRNHQWDLSKRLIQLLIRLEIIKNDRHPLYTEEINYNNRLRSLLENLSKPKYIIIIIIMNSSFNARLTELNSLKNVQGWKFSKDNIQLNDKQKENLENVCNFFNIF